MNVQRFCQLSQKTILLYLQERHEILVSKRNYLFERQQQLEEERKHILARQLELAKIAQKPSPR
jgi:hypothetical protein